MHSALGESKQNTKAMYSSVTISNNMSNAKKKNNKIPTGDKKGNTNGKLQRNKFENQMKTNVFSCVLFQSAAADLFCQILNFTCFFFLQWGKKKIVIVKVIISILHNAIY